MNKTRTRQIVVPQQLQGLKSSQMLSKSRATSPIPKQSARRAVSVLNQRPPQLPRISTQGLGQQALDTGIAVKIIPVDYYIDRTGAQDDFLKTVDNIEQRLNQVYDPELEILSGQGYTQYWDDAKQDRTTLKWVDCDILAKIDTDKFLVFILEQHCYKIVSNANIIFRDLVLQQDSAASPPDQDGSMTPPKAETQINISMASVLQELKKPLNKEFMIRVFKQQRKNIDLQRQFQEAIRDFGNMAISITKKQFMQLQNMSEFTVAVLGNKTGLDLRRIQNVVGNAGGTAHGSITTAQTGMLQQNIENRLYQCMQMPVGNLDRPSSYISSATILCSDAISKLDFSRIDKQVCNFRLIQERICAEFLQHAQLTDSQLQVLQQACEDPEHKLHWCSGFLSLFLWSSYRLFQTNNVFEYCYGITGTEFSQEDCKVIQRHRDMVAHTGEVIRRHITNMQHECFRQLSQYIYNTFNDHKSDIMLGALHVVPTLWSSVKPQVQPYMQQTFNEQCAGDAFDRIFVDLRCTTATPFNLTFEERLVNSHKLVYQIIAPHFVDQIISNFADQVIRAINGKLHRYQTMHGRAPGVALQNQYTQESYAEAHEQYGQVFKVIEIKYYNLFINELYQDAVPQWFYFLLALLHGYSKNRGAGAQQTELLRLINLTPNVQTYYDHIFNDIRSLNKQADFEIPVSNELANKTVEMLGRLEFQILPSVGESCIEGISIQPDPLEVANYLEQAIQNLAIYYSSSPKLTNSLVYNYKTRQAKNYFTIEQREYCLDYKRLNYRDYLKAVYTGQQLTNEANQNPLGINFDDTEVIAAMTEKIDARKAQKRAQQEELGVVPTNDELKEEAEEEAKRYRTETKFAEVTYYDSSRIVQKMVRISKIAAEKLKKYFEIFTRYFTLHIQKTQVYLQQLFDKSKLFPAEVAACLSNYDELLQHLNVNKFLKQGITPEERIRQQLKPLSQFLQLHQTVKLFSMGYQSGDSPNRFLTMIFSQTVADTLKTLKSLYDSIYDIMVLPSLCYYSAARINVTQLLQSLQQTDRVLFDYYSARLCDYVTLVTSVLCENLSQISTDIDISFFSNITQIGELYKIYKLFRFSMGDWKALFQLISEKIAQYEMLPLGLTSAKHYQVMLQSYVSCRLKYKDVNIKMERITQKVVNAFNHSKQFIQQIQQYFETLINSEIYVRAHEYVNISESEWERCESDQLAFSRAYPYTNKDVQFPKYIRQPDEINNLVDFKQLKKDVEARFGYNIFGIVQKQVKIRIFQRTSMQFRKQQLNDVFCELEDLIDRTIDVMQYLNSIQNQLLFVQQQQVTHFDKIDELIFLNQQKKEQYIKELVFQGEVVEMNRNTIGHIIENYELANTTQLSRLQSLQKIIKLLTMLIIKSTNFRQQYTMWNRQPIALLYADDVRNNIIDQINICTQVTNNFNPSKYQITSFAANLINFMICERKNILQMFMLKASIYESAIKTVEVCDDEIVKRPEIDRMIKIDIMDFAVPSNFIKQIFQSQGIKTNEDSRTDQLLGHLAEQRDNIYYHIRSCQKLVRYEKISYYIVQNLTRMINVQQEYGILQDNFEVIRCSAAGGARERNMALSGCAKQPLGRDAVQIPQQYEVFYYRENFSNQLAYCNLVSDVGYVKYTGNSAFLDFLTKTIELLERQIKQQTINVQHGSMLIGQLSSMKQMHQLLCENYRYIQQISILNDIANSNRSDVFHIQEATAQEWEQIGDFIDATRQCIANCFTTYSNAAQYVGKRFNRERMWAQLFALKQVYAKMYRVTSGYFNGLATQDDTIIQMLLHLAYYDVYATPTIRSARALDGCLVFWLPSEIVDSASAVLRYMGFRDCSFAILNYCYKDKASGKSVSAYLVDGLMSQNGYYFKFICPLRLSAIRDVYLEVSTDTLQKLIQLTLEHHMAFWEDLIFSNQIDAETGADVGVAFTESNLHEILQYPPPVSYAILSQLLVKCYLGVSYQGAGARTCASLLRQMQEALGPRPGEGPGRGAPPQALEQIQLSALTSLENYAFHGQSSVLSNYPSVPAAVVQRHAQKLALRDRAADAAKPPAARKRSIQDLLDEETAQKPGRPEAAEASDGSDIFGAAPAGRAHERCCMHGGFDAQDFRYLSQIAGQGPGEEHGRALAYLRCVCRQMAQSVSAGVVYNQFCLFHTTKTARDTARLAADAVAGVWQSPRKESQYSPSLYYHACGIDVPALSAHPKFCSGHASPSCEETVANFSATAGQIVCGLHMHSDVILIYPKGRQLDQRVHAFIQDLLGMAMQTHILVLDVASCNFAERLQRLRAVSCLLLLTNYHHITSKNMSCISQFCLNPDTPPRKCKIIHLLQAGMPNCLGKDLIDRLGLYHVQQINQQDQLSNIIHLHQFDHNIQAQALTYQLVLEFEQMAICPEVLDALTSCSDTVMAAQVIAKILMGKYPNQLNKIEQAVKETLGVHVDLNSHTEPFVYQVVPLGGQVKYRSPSGPSNSASKDERLNKHISALVHIDEDVPQKMVLNTLGFQYITEALYLLLELGVEKFGISDGALDMQVIRQFKHFFDSTIRQQTGLSYISICGEKDIRRHDDGEALIDDHTFYFIVYDKMTANSEYKAQLTDFLLQPRPYKSYILLYSNDTNFTAAHTQYYEERTPDQQLIDNELALSLEMEENVVSVSQCIDQNDILNKKTPITQTEFDYIINNFNVNQQNLRYILKLQRFTATCISTLFSLICFNIFEITDSPAIGQVLRICLSQMQINGFLTVQNIENDTDSTTSFIPHGFRYQLQHKQYLSLVSGHVLPECYGIIIVGVAHTIFNACYLQQFMHSSKQDIRRQQMVVHFYKTMLGHLQVENKTKKSPQMAKLIGIMDNEKISIDEYILFCQKVLGPIGAQIRQQGFQQNKFKLFQLRTNDTYRLSLQDVLLMRRRIHVASASNETNLVVGQFRVQYDYMNVIDAFYNAEPESWDRRDGDVFLTQTAEFVSRVKYFYEISLRNGIKGEYMEALSVQIHLLYAAAAFGQPVWVINGNRYLTELVVENFNLLMTVKYQAFVTYKAMYNNRASIELRRLSYTIQGKGDFDAMVGSMRPFVELNDHHGAATFFPYTVLKIYINGALDEQSVGALQRLLLTKTATLASDCGEKRSYKLTNVQFVVIGENAHMHATGLSVIDFQGPSSSTQAFSDRYVQDLEQFYQKPFNAVEVAQPHGGSATDISELPFFDDITLGVRQFNLLNKTDGLQMYLANLYNFNNYLLYKNALTFYFFKDVCRCLFSDQLKGNFEKFNKYDKAVGYDFSNELLNDAKQFEFVQMLYGSVSVQMSVPLTIITRPTISYCAFVQYLQVMSRATMDMMHDVNKQNNSRTLLVDFSSLAQQHVNYNYTNKQVFGNMVQQTVGVQTRMVVKNVMLQCLRISKLLPAEKAGSAPFSCSNNQQAWTLNYHGQSINFDNSRLLQFHKGQFFYQFVFVFPISLLIGCGMLSQVYQLAYPDSDAGSFLTYDELQEIQAEAAAYTNYDVVNLQIINMLLAQRLQVYLYDDVGYCAEGANFWPCYANVCGMPFTESDTQLILQERLNVGLVKRIFTQQDMGIQTAIRQFGDSDPGMCVAQYDSEEKKLNRLLVAVLKEPLADSAVGAEHLVRLSRYLLGKIRRRAAAAIEMLDQVYQKLEYITYTYKELQAEQQVELDRVHNLGEQNTATELEIKAVMSETAAVSGQITCLQQDGRVQQELNQIELQIVDEQNRQRQQLQQMANQIKTAARRASLRGAVVNAHQLYLFQMLLNCYNKGQNFDNYNDNYKALPKQQYVQQAFDLLQQDLTGGLFTVNIAQINPAQLPAQTKQKLLDVFEKCTREQISQSTGNSYLELVVGFAIKLYVFVQGENETLKQLNDRKSELQALTNEQSEKLRALQAQTKELKQRQQDLEKKLATGQQDLQHAMVVREAILAKDQLYYELEPRIQRAIGKYGEHIRRLKSMYNLGEWTAVFTSLYIFYGFNLMSALFEKLVPNDTDICVVCQQLQANVCQICQNCECLCTCQYGYDKFQQRKLLHPGESRPPINEYFSSKQVISNAIQQLFLCDENTRSFAEFVTQHDNDDIQELSGALLFSECFVDEVILLSRKNHPAIVAILQQPQTATEIIHCDGMPLERIENQILNWLQKEKEVNVVFVVEKLSPSLIFLLNKLVNVNRAINRQYFAYSTPLCGQTYKITNQSPKIRYYLIVSAECAQSWKKVPHLIAGCMALQNSQFMTLDEIAFNKNALKRGNEHVAQLIRRQKHQLQNTIVRTFHPQLFRELTSTLTNINSITINKMNAIASILTHIRELTRQTMHQALGLVKSNSDELERLRADEQRLRERYMELHTKLLEHIDSRETNEYMAIYQQVVSQLSHFASNYPQIIRLISPDAFFVNEKQLIRRGVTETHADRVYQDQASHDQLALTFQFAQQQLQHELAQPILDQFLIYMLYVQSIATGRLSKDDVRFVALCFSNVGKGNVMEILKISNTGFCREMYNWAVQYQQEFNTITQQDNLVKYIKDYYKRNLLPDCLRTFTLKSICLLFAVQVVSNTRQSLHVQCREVLQSCICGKYQTKTISFKEALLSALQLNKSQQQGTTARTKCVIIMTSHGKIVQRILSDTAKVVFQPVQAAEEIDLRSTKVFIISNARCDLYGYEFMEFYIKHRNDIILICTDLFEYQVEEDADERHNVCHSEIDEIRQVAIPMIARNYSATFKDQSVQQAHISTYYANKCMQIAQYHQSMNAFSQEVKNFLAQIAKGGERVNQLQYIKLLTRQPLAVQHFVSANNSFWPLSDADIAWQMSMCYNGALKAGEAKTLSRFAAANCHAENLMLSLQCEQLPIPVQCAPVYRRATPYNYISLVSLLQPQNILPALFELVQSREPFHIDSECSSDEHLRCTLDGKAVCLKKGKGGRETVWLKSGAVCFEVEATVAGHGYCEEGEV